MTHSLFTINHITNLVKDKANKITNTIRQKVKPFSNNTVQDNYFDNLNKRNLKYLNKTLLRYINNLITSDSYKGDTKDLKYLYTSLYNYNCASLPIKLLIREMISNDYNTKNLCIVLLERTEELVNNNWKKLKRVDLEDLCIILIDYIKNYNSKYNHSVVEYTIFEQQIYNNYSIKLSEINE